jgi:hypothetical protein
VASLPLRCRHIRWAILSPTAQIRLTPVHKHTNSELLIRRKWKLKEEIKAKDYGKRLRNQEFSPLSFALIFRPYLHLLGVKQETVFGFVNLSWSSACKDMVQLLRS